MLLTSQVIAIADQVNRNNRIYPKVVLEKVLAAVHHEEEGELLGQMGIANSGKIELARVSHVARNMMLDGDKLTADIHVLDTPSGKELKKVIADQTMAFRMVGIGSVERVDDSWQIKDDYRLQGIIAVPASEAS